MEVTVKVEKLAWEFFQRIPQASAGGAVKVPIVITVIAAIAFIVLFNEQKYQADAEAVEQGTANA